MNASQEKLQTELLKESVELVKSVKVFFLSLSMYLERLPVRQDTSPCGAQPSSSESRDS